jgi:lipid-A-disaccharide synthase
MEKKQVIIVCGEASGDLHAANLCSALKIQYPQIKVFAVGGELLRKAGAEVFYDIKDISVFGFFDALIKLPKFFALKKLVIQKIRQIKPDALVLVDFSGFNLRLAKALNNSVEISYYVSPQVWASRTGRINTICLKWPRAI